MTESEAIVFTEVYQHERERGANTIDACNTAAFAVYKFKREATNPSEGYTVTGLERGMTLRDYFAAQALMGMLSWKSEGASPTEFAEVAYNHADAMLAERENRNV